MPWTDAYTFSDPFEAVCRDSAEPFAAELVRELGPEHPLFGRACAVIARAMPQDDVVVVCGEEVAVVHLTWKGSREAFPWPGVTFMPTAAAFESFVEHKF